MYSLTESRPETVGVMACHKSQGRIIIPGGVNVWPHELRSARALVAVGYVVEFVQVSRIDGVCTADVIINGQKWEMKAPISGQLASVERNLRRGSKQAENIVFDSRRMKQIPDEAVRRELCIQLHRINRIRRIIFINRHRKVIDIE